MPDYSAFGSGYHIIHIVRHTTMPQNTILIISKDINLRETLAFILRSAGYAVTIADRLYKPTRTLDNGEYDLVFLDLKTSHSNEKTLLSKTHQMYPDLPLLILTTKITLDGAIEAVRYGVRDCLLKPADPVLILARVQEILGECETA